MNLRVPDGKWLNYDYIFDKTSNKMELYVNGYPVLTGVDVSGQLSQITGIHRLNFQVRDMATGESVREIDTYVDDIKVTYSKNAPVVSPYSAFGEAAKIDAPEQYVNNEVGIIYNYGQTLSDMKKYLSGKNAYLAAEKYESTGDWLSYSKYSSESLESITLQDGRVVEPILCVEEGDFIYCYKVRQPQATAINPALTAAENSITLTWEGNAANCRGIEIFRDGEKIAQLEGSAKSYTDTNVTANTAYDYTIRELLPDNNVSAFTDTVSNVRKPENFTAAQVLGRQAVKLTWEAPSIDGATGYEIYRNGALLAAVDADVFEYTDSSSIKKDTTYHYSIAAIFGEMKSGKTAEVSVFVSLGSSDSRVIYTENFNNRNWWDGETPTAEQFNRKPFWSYLDDEANMESSYELKAGANGRTADDKSLHINEKFKLAYGKNLMEVM